MLTQSLIQCRLVRQQLKVAEHPVRERFLPPLDIQLDTLELELDNLIFFTGDI